MKITLNPKITFKEDQIYKGSTQFDPSLMQNTLGIFHSRSYSRFRYSLEKLTVKDLAIIMSFQNVALNERIWLHLSKESKAELKVFLGIEANLSEKEREYFIQLFDLEMMVS